jgi:hypothetical protein
MTYAESVVISASPDEVCAVVSDIARTGEGIPATLAAMKRIIESGVASA